MSKCVGFAEILNEVRSIIKDLRHWDSFSNCNIEVLSDDECGYRAIFEFDNCLGEIIVNLPDFAPYRYVRLEVLSAVTNENECLFIWCDSDYDDTASVRKNILWGLQVAVEYASKCLKS